MSNVSSSARWLSSFSLWKKSASGTVGLHLNPASPGGGPRPTASMSLAQHSRMLKRGSERLRSLLSFDYISLGLGGSRHSFKLSNLFPRSSWGCAGASPYSIPFLDLQGFCALILFSIFPRFSQARLLLFMVASFASTAHAS